MDMVNSQSPGAGANVADSESYIDELIKSREDALHRKTRDDLDLKLKEIQEKDEKRFDHDPVHPFRPYGLAEGMEGHWMHIWDLILTHVNDVDTIANLREVCTLFKDLLERKYKAARLPEVVVKCLDRNFIPWKESRTERSNWVKTLQDLRNLSKTTKNSVDIQFRRGMLGYQLGADEDEAEWFSMRMRRSSPNHRTEEWKIPTLMLGAIDVEQARLQRTLDNLEIHEASTIDSFPMKTLIFNERQLLLDPLPVDLPYLRNGFQKCLEKIGWKITSFHYKTNENAMNTYDILRRWVAHMPNLEELIVDFSGFWLLAAFNSEDYVGPFPRCANLKRFAEGPKGFGYPFINKILEANPTIQEMLLGELSSSSSEFQMNKLNQALQTVHLKKLYSTCALTIPFFECTFQWTLTLTSFAFLDKRTEQLITLQELIASGKIFQFLSQFKNLQILGIMSPCIRDAGGYLNLPKLQHMHLRILPGFRNLEFLKPCESMELLYLDVASYPDLQPKEKSMELLEKYHIPSMFPALKIIEVNTEMFGGCTTVWKR